MTVSRVINHPEKVSAELRKLVLTAMRELNYVPNYAARALVKNRTQVIKLLILEEMDTTEPYYMNLLSGIAIELDKHHYALQLVTRNSRAIGNCDGLIITGMRAGDYDEIIDQMDRPFILFGQNDRGYDYVDVDNEEGTELTTKHLIHLGFKRILFFGIDLKEPFMLARAAGYKKTMSASGLGPELFFMKNSSHVAQEEAAKQLTGRCPRTAIVCASDRIAIGVVRAGLALGLHIPDEAAITGFDGVFLDRISCPKITTIRQPIIEMGKVCARRLLQKIHQGGDKIGSLTFEPELIIRESTIKKPDLH